MRKQDYVPPTVSDHGRVVSGTLGSPGSTAESTNLKF